MSSKKLAHYEQEVKAQKISVWIQHHLGKNNENLANLSIRLGKNAGFLRALALRGDPKVSHLIALGNKLNANPWDAFSTLISTPTHTETTQAARIAELEAQLTAVEKERDWLKEVVMKK